MCDSFAMLCAWLAMASDWPSSAALARPQGMTQTCHLHIDKKAHSLGSYLPCWELIYPAESIDYVETNFPAERSCLHWLKDAFSNTKLKDLSIFNVLKAAFCYSLRPIILFANTDVSRHILVIDTSVFAKSNMGRREYYSLANKKFGG
jgi:hypothetical protein